MRANKYIYDIIVCTITNLKHQNLGRPIFKIEYAFWVGPKTGNI